MVTALRQIHIYRLDVERGYYRIDGMPCISYINDKEIHREIVFENVVNNESFKRTVFISGLDVSWLSCRNDKWIHRRWSMDYPSVHVHGVKDFDKFIRIESLVHDIPISYLEYQSKKVLEFFNGN